MKIAACVLIFLLIGMMIAAESDIVGEIVLLDGTVTIHRNNREIADIDSGLQIENFDQLITGPAGMLEITIYPETGIQALHHTEGKHSCDPRHPGNSQ